MPSAAMQQWLSGLALLPNTACSNLPASPQVWPGPAVSPDYMSSAAVGPWLNLTTLLLSLFAASLLSGVAWPCCVP
jgi:hypothetical protein